MLLFAHPGITLGAATIAADIINRKPSWFASLSRYLDIRWLLVGSILPDIIDKTVGQVIFRDTFNNGRIFSHSLFFLIILTAIGYYLLKRHRQSWLLAIAAGVFAHLILDEMWQVPVTFLWPLFGFSFPVEDLDSWTANMWNALLTDPKYYISEIVGLVILLILCWWLISKKKIISFIKHGKVS